MTLAEEIKQLYTFAAPAISKLGVNQYTYWSEAQHGINVLHGNNLLHGYNHRGDSHLLSHAYHSVHATSFPTNFASTMSWDPKLIYRETQAISDEARGFLDKSLWGKAQNNLGSSRKNYGLLTYWAPTINMDRDPRWGRTDEAFGEDPYLASQIAEAFVNGMQGQTMNGKSKTGYLKVAATAKHFALNNVEDDRHSISSNASDRAIRDYYTTTFSNLINKANVAGLMTSYNAINGTPATANTYILNELAQRTYGFRGYVTSDFRGIGTTYLRSPFGHDWAPPGWSTNHDGQNAIWLNKQTGDTLSGAAGGLAYALRAGTDLINCASQGWYTRSNLKAAIKAAINAGILSKGVIDRALAYVLTIRMETGEFDPPGKVPYTKIRKSVIQSPAHQKLAEKVAENSLVLLKDKPVPGMNKSLLPVNVSKLHKVVILGNLANKVSLGGYSGNPSLQVSAVQGIKMAVKKANPKALVVSYGAGTSTTAKVPASLSAKAKADIQDADLVIVFVGTDEMVASEAHDRANLAMPGNYNSLIRKVAAQGNPKMTLVIQSDGPVKIDNVQKKFPAIVFSGYNGES
jgi:beta-glucosidase-like glycosyl hydrolase